MNLLGLMKMKNITKEELAKKLDISVTQIYKWNKHGISKNNRHFKKLQSILPEVKPREPTLRINQEEDQRYNSGRKRQASPILTETNIKSPIEKEFVSSLFPKIIRKKQAE